MHVKIIKSHPHTWYTHLIGKECEVTDNRLQNDLNGEKYIVTKDGGIYCSDYVEVDKYPTLKKRLPMHVKIIKSKTTTTWYVNLIGKEFKVIDKTEFGDKYGPYIITTHGGVYCDDFIEMEMDRYPTLKSDYCK